MATFKENDVESFGNKAETHYSITRNTQHFPGIVQAPIAGPKGTACKFIRTHAPYEVERIDWTATSEAGPPVIPSPFGENITTGLNSNLIFLGSAIGRVIPVLLGGGSSGHVWSISGTYWYGAVEVTDVVRNYTLGKYPWEKDVEPEDNYLPVGAFDTGILDTRVDMPDLQNPVRGP